MKHSTLFWILAFVLTLAAGYYQRVTGPSYPLSGNVALDGRTISFKLERSHGGETHALVQLRTEDESVVGILEWRRHKTDDLWTRVKMGYAEGVLSSELPHQPPAGKLQYRVTLQRGEHKLVLPPDEPVIIRFRGDVPWRILIPHVTAMFAEMLLSTRGGLEYFNKEPKFKLFAYWTLGILFVGGFVLGPIMQHYAFNVWWTGWPMGTDLTDNKTAVAFLGWVIATIALHKTRNPKAWVLAAAILLMSIYLIPHSLLGTELDYRELDNQRTVQSTE